MLTHVTRYTWSRGAPVPLRGTPSDPITWDAIMPITWDAIMPMTWGAIMPCMTHVCKGHVIRGTPVPLGTMVPTPRQRSWLRGNGLGSEATVLAPRQRCGLRDAVSMQGRSGEAVQGRSGADSIGASRPWSHAIILSCRCTPLYGHMDGRSM
jgi:hypothetical protein